MNTSSSGTRRIGQTPLRTRPPFDVAWGVDVTGTLPVLAIVHVDRCVDKHSLGSTPAWAPDEGLENQRIGARIIIVYTTPGPFFFFFL